MLTVESEFSSQLLKTAEAVAVTAHQRLLQLEIKGHFCCLHQSHHYQMSCGNIAE